MTKIIEKTKKQLNLKVGDWVWAISKSTDMRSLCVIAQTESGIIELISISKDDAIRLNDLKTRWDKDGGTYCSLSQKTLNELVSDDYTLQKVDVEITVL